MQDHKWTSEDKISTHFLNFLCCTYTKSCSQNICVANDTEANEVVYEECSSITEITGDVAVMRNFIMNHAVRFSMFNHLVPLKMLAIAEIVTVIVMLRRFKEISMAFLFGDCELWNI